MRLPSMRVIYSEPARQAGSFDVSLVKIASTELKPIYTVFRFPIPDTEDARNPKKFGCPN